MDINLFIEKYVAELILIILYSGLLIREINVLRFTYWQFVLYSTLLLIYVYGIFRDNTFGLYGLYSIFLMIFIYVNIFRRFADILYLIKLYKEIKFVIFVNIIFILFENMINIAGLERFLDEITNQRYRLDLYAPLTYLNIINFTSANSLILKAQGASILLAISIILYLDPFKLNELYYRKNYNYKWLFGLSLILYLIQFTTTSMIALFLMIILAVFFFPSNKMQFRLSKGAFLFVLILFFPVILKIIFFKFDGFTIDQVYIDVAYHSFKIFYFFRY